MGWAWRRWPELAVAVGLGLVALCLIYPQVVENQRLRAERERLEQEFARVEARIEANTAFLRQARDPGPVGAALRQRLAERQLRVLPAGAEPIALPGLPEDPRSPFHLILAALQQSAVVPDDRVTSAGPAGRTVAGQRGTPEVLSAVGSSDATGATAGDATGSGLEDHSSSVGGGSLHFLERERLRLFLLAGGLMLIGTGLICDTPLRGVGRRSAAGLPSEVEAVSG